MILLLTLLLPLPVSTIASTNQEDELALAQKQAQLWIDKFSENNPYFLEWKGASAKLTNLYYSLQGDLNACMFNIIKNNNVVGHLVTGASQYNYDMFQAGKSAPPSMPSEDKIKSALQNLGIMTSGSIGSPAQLLFTGIHGFYALYNINDQKIAIDLFSNNAFKVSDLKSTLPSPQAYNESRQATKRARTLTLGFGNYMLDMAHWDAPGRGACGPCSGVSIGRYYKDVRYYNSLPAIDNGAMYDELYIHMQTSDIYGTLPSNYGPGFTQMANESNTTYNFGYSLDSIVTGEDYWAVVNDIDNKHPTALEITSGWHWWAIRGYYYNDYPENNSIYCTNSQMHWDAEVMNWNALGYILWTVAIRDLGDINGETWEVKGVILPQATVILDYASSVISTPQGQYVIDTSTTGQHTLIASKIGFRHYTRNINVENLNTLYNVKFKGNYGLVPNNPNLSCVLNCINKWKFPPDSDPELGLNMTKVLAVINAWKFPSPNLNPNAGLAGTVINISGGLFASHNTSGVVWFDSNNNSVLDAGEPSVAVTTTDSGEIPAGVYLTVPPVATGMYNVRSDIPIGGTVEASSGFVVTSLPVGMVAGGSPPKAPTTPPKLLLTTSNPVRDLPSAPVSPGQTFQVTVTFTAPADEFNAVGLTDFAPSGWNVNVSSAWCTPAPMSYNKVNNRAEYAWSGPYSNATAFTAVYQVTVPVGTAPGNYNFTNGTLEYYTGGTGPAVENVTGETTVTVQ